MGDRKDDSEFDTTEQEDSIEFYKCNTDSEDSHERKRVMFDLDENSISDNFEPRVLQNQEREESFKRLFFLVAAVFISCILVCSVVALCATNQPSNKDI